MKAVTLLLSAGILTGCVVNPDADRELRNAPRRSDTLTAAPGTIEPALDTGQHDMPVIKPTAPAGSDMPVVNPADSAAHQPL